MTTHTFTTTAILPSGNEQEVTVTYTYQAGYKGDYYQPPEPPTVEIQSVTPDVPESCYNALVGECFEDYATIIENAAERRWEDRRDDYV